MDGLTEKCAEYEISRIKRNYEIAKGMGKKGTLIYEEWGCYDCDGFDSSCPNYINPKMEYGRLHGKHIF